MDLQIKLKALAEKIALLKDKIETEESTKHAFILPFINILGYDTFNPLEVVPEFTADLGLKKGEKVDYAIFQNGEPILIIECKNWNKELTTHNSQLFRYFHVTKTRFSLLTNGIKYQFFTDLEAKNIMDDKPFLEFDITNLKDSTINEIAKFHSSNFDVNKIITNASDLKYTQEIKNLIEKELESPTHEFVRFFAGRAYSGRLTEKVLIEFTDLVSKAFAQIISESVNNRLNAALKKEEAKQLDEVVDHPEINKVETTDEELEAFRIAVAILRRNINIERIVPRDTQSYFGVLLDDNNRKPLCRFHFNGNKKYLGLFDENKLEKKYLIEDLNEIYQYEEELLKSIAIYE
ncbi:type I restriction endonuclease [Flavobacterium sp. NKUCC04_CG]|uniref:type I restriction endonuclease n=1 Tax=Flavobacterium sp. NKUCC04_CG TaxID=2842121 RepID=UPI001C5BC030|nr:type I restriction endonuclease [Flavobacterium sp. NKUCC04_CG]MBW3518285.1 type I restriction enzyme HsdR N-terminal domain-containing protein [Flavobacterium sp. NKUCC04_CG]